MRTIVCMLFAAIFFSAGFASFCPAGEVPAEIKKAADAGINVFFRDPRMTGLHNLGFKSQSDLDNAYAGEGFQVFTIPPDRLLNKNFPQDLAALVIQTNQWQFLVMSTDGAKALLAVDIMNNTWTPVSIGAAGLAKELSAIMDAWPESSGYAYRFITVNEANAEFIELSQGSKVLGIVPLGTAKKGYSSADIKSPQDMLPGLRQAAQENIRAWQQKVK